MTKATKQAEAASDKAVTDGAKNGALPLIGREREAGLIKAVLGERIPLALVGPTGCGKTYLVETICHQMELPMRAVSGSAGASIEQLVGFWRPESNDGQGVSLRWQDGTLTETVRQGGVFVFEEMSRAPQEIMGRLFSLCDTHHARYNVPEHGNGDAVDVPVHEAFRFIACFNDYGAGYFVSRVDVAFLDRFAVIKLGYPSQEEEIAILRLHLPTAPDRLVVAMADVAAQTRQQLDEVNALSTRDLVLWARLTKAVGDSVVAFGLAVGGKKRQSVDEHMRNFFEVSGS